MPKQERVDISNVVDSSKIGSFHLAIGVLCGLCLMIDGFDVQAMAYAAPALIKDWQIPGQLEMLERSGHNLQPALKSFADAPCR